MKITFLKTKHHGSWNQNSESCWDCSVVTAQMPKDSRNPKVRIKNKTHLKLDCTKWTNLYITLFINASPGRPQVQGSTQDSRALTTRGIEPSKILSDRQSLTNMRH